VIAGLDTGISAWYPLAMVAGLIAMAIVVFVIRMFGRKDFKHSKNKAMPYYSGHAVSDGNRVKASDFYWGFFEAFSGFYEKMRRMHSGNPNDYVFWFVFTASIVLIVLVWGVVQ